MTAGVSAKHRDEIERGQRFRFGENWTAFLRAFDDDRLAAAAASLQEMLEVDRLDGRVFLDAGSGSGLFSLAARTLGARVYSFDYDPESVACTTELRRRFFPNDESWIVREGSVLDEGFVDSLPQADIVYSWGVLHHSGDLWRAMALLDPKVAQGGQFFIALYNDEGAVSRGWRVVKKVYCASWLGRAAVMAAFMPVLFVATALSGLTSGDPTKRFREYRRHRGMSIVRDWVDWLGGYPFEVASPRKVFDFFRRRGYRLTQLRTTNRMGCNEFVFQKVSGYTP